MSQILALTETGLNLLTFPTLKKLDVYYPEKSLSKGLHAVDICNYNQQPLFLQLCNDQKTVEAVRVKVEEGKGSFFLARNNS